MLKENNCKQFQWGRRGRGKRTCFCASLLSSLKRKNKKAPGVGQTWRGISITVMLRPKYTPTQLLNSASDDIPDNISAGCSKAKSIAARKLSGTTS